MAFEDTPMKDRCSEPADLSETISTDIQFAHLVLERCSFQSQTLGRSALPGYFSRGAFQRVDDDLSCGGFESGSGRSSRVTQLCLGNMQGLALREDHTTLNEVFQLPNVARPIGVHQRLHSLHWNAIDVFLHLPRVA